MSDRLEAERRHRLEHQIVDVAESPIFTRLEGADDRVLRRVEVLCPVFIRRVVATADVSAREAEAEVDPLGADLQAFFAALRSLRLLGVDLVVMFAGLRGHSAAQNS